MAKAVDALKIDPNMRLEQANDAGVAWHSPMKAPFQLAGLPWLAQDGLYRRLPVKPQWPLPPSVDSLADCTAGVQVRFRTDSARVLVRVKLPHPSGMYHMPATGQSGFDCYLGPVGATRYYSTTRFDVTATEYEVELYKRPGKKLHLFTLNFPLYQRVKQLEIGLDKGARILPPPKYDSNRRVIVYGTSVTQGGCASRPGMAYTNILSRRINREFINLGFSGSGRGEPEVARNIASIERPALFILDYEANCTDPALLRQTFPEFIRILREAHPCVPILALSRIRFAKDLFHPDQERLRRARNRFQRTTVEALRRGGDKRIFFMAGSALLGPDFDECAVDGIHLTDLGFLRLANALEPVVRKALRAGQ